MGNKFWILYIVAALLLTSCAHYRKNTVSSKRQMASVDPSKVKELLWPLRQTKMSRGFNPDPDDPHDGLDIPAPTGEAIKAVASGRVVYSGRAFHGYGKMVLIEHDGNLATLYAHCSKISVKSGQFVKKGKIIGYVGKTGRASAPHLHFEVRKNKKPIDPMEFYQ